MSKVPAFKASRLTPTTFLVVEHSDSYDEHPFIYVKSLNESTLLVLDTGCGGKTPNHEINLWSLREFIETVDIGDNGGKPLNPDGTKKYIVVLSHCHYDHILGVAQFAKDSRILVSGHVPDFTSPSNLPEHSLCAMLNIDVPNYTPTYVPHMHAIEHDHGAIRVLHTPGHTPDELALWDESERMLYVGDSLYEWASIIFPNEGSIVAWLGSVDALLQLVEPFKDARISSGHVTAGQPAAKVLTGAKDFVRNVLNEELEPTEPFEKRGELHAKYVRDDHRFKLEAPVRLIEEARQ